jgi:hypothetical protein
VETAGKNKERRVKRLILRDTIYAKYKDSEFLQGWQVGELHVYNYQLSD